MLVLFWVLGVPQLKFHCSGQNVSTETSNPGTHTQTFRTRDDLFCCRGLCRLCVLGLHVSAVGGKLSPVTSRQPPASTQTRSDIMGAPLQAVLWSDRRQSNRGLFQVLFTMTQLTVSSSTKLHGENSAVFPSTLAW